MTGTKLKRLRLSAGLSQSKLSRISEISQGTISKIEGGTAHIAQLKIGVGKRLAFSLGTTLDGLTSVNGSRNEDVKLQTITSNYQELSDDGKLQLVNFSNYLLKYS